MKATRTLSSKKLPCHTPARSATHSRIFAGGTLRGSEVCAPVLSFRVHIQFQMSIDSCIHMHTCTHTHGNN